MTQDDFTSMNPAESAAVSGGNPGLIAIVGGFIIVAVAKECISHYREFEAAFAAAWNRSTVLMR